VVRCWQFASRRANSDTLPPPKLALAGTDCALNVEGIIRYRTCKTLLLRTFSPMAPDILLLHLKLAISSLLHACRSANTSSRRPLFGGRRLNIANADAVRAQVMTATSVHAFLTRRTAHITLLPSFASARRHSRVIYGTFIMWHTAPRRSG